MIETNKPRSWKISTVPPAIQTYRSRSFIKSFTESSKECFNVGSTLNQAKFGPQIEVYRNICGHTRFACRMYYNQLGAGFKETPGKPLLQSIFATDDPWCFKTPWSSFLLGLVGVTCQITTLKERWLIAKQLQLLRWVYLGFNSWVQSNATVTGRPTVGWNKKWSKRKTVFQNIL